MTSFLRAALFGALALVACTGRIDGDESEPTTCSANGELCAVQPIEVPAPDAGVDSGSDAAVDAGSDAGSGSAGCDGH